ISDPDVFEIANMNRQVGATMQSIGQLKTDVMLQMALAINPDIQIEVIPGGVNPQNADELLKGADIFIDSLDLFELPLRSILFRKAKEQGIFSVTAGPMGFGTTWLVFDPAGMGFDEYFDIRKNMTPVERIISF